MKHFFLSSAIGTSGVCESIRRHLGHAKKVKTAFITTPIEVEDMTDDSWYQADRSALTKNGFDFFDYTVTGKSSLDFDKDLAGVEAIYVSGGNTRHLLKQSQLSGFTEYIRSFVDAGNLYLSTSAGSIIAGPELPKYLWGEEIDAPNIQDFKSYSLVDFTLIPHWGSKDFKELYLGGRIDEIYSPSLQPFICCNDHEYIEVIDDKFHIVDVRNKI